MFGIPLFPERASTIAGEVDALYFFLVGLSVVMSVLIATLVVGFAVKFHRRHADDVGAQVHGGLVLELAWTIVPFLITLVIFFWGAKVYFVMASPPEETLNIYVVGKQWMWKVQHTTGQREINQLHVPVGRPVKLIMTSEDVIHNFSIPAMRVKADVIPGRFVQIWFEPTRPGTYQIFCAEYCGTQHSGMIGQVVVMEAHGVSDLAERRRGGGLPCLDGRKAVRRSCVQHVPPPRLARTRAGAAKRVRSSRAAARRHGGDGRRELSSRVDSDTGRKGHRRLSAGDAGIPGTGQRGTAACAD